MTLEYKDATYQGQEQTMSRILFGWEYLEFGVPPATHFLSNHLSIFLNISSFLPRFLQGALCDPPRESLTFIYLHLLV